MVFDISGTFSPQTTEGPFDNRQIAADLDTAPTAYLYNGALCYQTGTSSANSLPPGLYVFDGSSWNEVSQDILVNRNPSTLEYITHANDTCNFEKVNWTSDILVKDSAGSVHQIGSDILIHSKELIMSLQNNINTTQNAPRIRAGVDKKDQKAELKKNQTRRCYAGKTSIFPPDNRQTPARREARNHRSEDAKMLGPPPCGPQRTGRAD